MPDTSTHLLLPYLLASQAQKHATHNEALRLLDGLVQLAVLDRDLTAPLGSPADGDRYIVASGATGEWDGWDASVAYWVDGAWMRLVPRPGWRAWVEDEGVLLVFDGSVWTAPLPAVLQNLSLLGIGTTADAGNPFAAKLNAALWTAKTVAEGGTGDIFYTMNKEYIMGAALTSCSRKQCLGGRRLDALPDAPRTANARDRPGCCAVQASAMRPAADVRGSSARRA